MERERVMLSKVTNFINSFNDQCGICYEPFDRKTSFVYGHYIINRQSKKIFHLFHKNCIDNWLNIRNECPVCLHRLVGNYRFENWKYGLVSNVILKISLVSVATILFKNIVSILHEEAILAGIIGSSSFTAGIIAKVASNYLKFNNESSEVLSLIASSSVIIISLNAFQLQCIVSAISSIAISYLFADISHFILRINYLRLNRSIPDEKESQVENIPMVCKTMGLWSAFVSMSSLYTGDKDSHIKLNVLLLIGGAVCYSVFKIFETAPRVIKASLKILFERE